MGVPQPCLSPRRSETKKVVYFSKISQKPSSYDNFMTNLVGIFRPCEQMKETISKISCISTKLGKAGLELLEALTIPETQRAEQLTGLKKHLDAAELVYVATCNRVEFIVFAPEASHDTADLRNRILDFFFRWEGGVRRIDFEPDNFRLFSGLDAVRHIFDVAASLDSIVIGEAQILGQVKEAHRFCQDNDLCGDLLDRLLAAAYKAAKMVRTDTDLGKKPVSMASLVALRLDQILAESSHATIAIVGSGSMTVKMAEIIRKHHANRLLFVNRTTAKVESMVKKYNGDVVGLDRFLAGLAKADIIISSTASPDPIFDHDHVSRIAAGRKLYVFDLAIPRDFAAELTDSETLEIWNLEKLNILAQANRRDRFRTVDQASRIIDDQARQYLQKEITQIISPLFDSALDESMAMAREGLANLFNGKLSHLSQKDRDLIFYWSKKVLARACYLPARQLAANIANSDVAPDLRLSYFAKNAR